MTPHITTTNQNGLVTTIQTFSPLLQFALEQFREQNLVYSKLYIHTSNRCWPQIKIAGPATQVHKASFIAAFAPMITHCNSTDEIMQKLGFECDSPELLEDIMLTFEEQMNALYKNENFASAA